MSYTTVDYPSKKALQTAFKSGVRIEIDQSSCMFPQDKDGDIVIEGPQYPKAHTFYQKVTIKDNVVVKLNWDKDERDRYVYVDHDGTQH